MAFGLTPGQKFELKAYCFHDSVQQLAVNTFRFVVTSFSGGSSYPSDTLVTQIGTILGPLYRALIGSDASYIGASIQDFPNREFVMATSNASAGTGTSILAMMPNQVAGLLTFKTNWAGRKGRGRAYIPFPTEEVSTSPGKPGVAYVENLDALGAYLTLVHNFVNGEQTLQTRMIIDNAEGSGGTKFVTSYVAQDQWATQRRRSAYGPKNSKPVEFNTIP